MKKIIKNISLALIALLGYFFLNKKYGLSIPCIFHELTGLYCPGCGITRCLFNLLQFNIKEAFFSNMLVFCMLPFFGIYFLYYCYITIKNKPNILNSGKYSWLYIILLIVVIGFGILRNFETFAILRPLT